MREALVSILTILAIAVPARCNEKDGFNFYKDYLRARSDEVPEGPPSGERLLYFYRTPLQLYPGLLPALEQEYRKRTGNAFKNHMLSKDLYTESEVPPPGKRGSKTALALMMEGKHYHTTNSLHIAGRVMFVHTGNRSGRDSDNPEDTLETSID